jgi:tetratricopeptide (TPR) repeat protein
MLWTDRRFAVFYIAEQHLRLSNRLLSHVQSFRNFLFEQLHNHINVTPLTENVMRKVFLIVWLLIPVGAWAYHYGPGQDRMDLDQVEILVDKAKSSSRRGEHDVAALLYDKALNQLPEGRNQEGRAIRLERAKAQMLAKQLPTARADLQSLLNDIANDETVAESFKDDVRSSLANSQYYMTWLMRLEGRSREDWEPEIEASRQSFRLLAEKAKKSGRSADVTKHQKDLESSIRLARMELKDLQGLPLPSQ